MITPNIGPKSVLGILRGTHPRMRGGTQSRTPSQTLNSWRGTEWRMWRDLPQAWVSKFHRIGFGLPDIHISTTWAWICWMLWRGNLQQTDSKCIYSKGFSRIFLVSGNQHGNWKPSVLIKTSMDRVRDFSLKNPVHHNFSQVKNNEITIFHRFKTLKSPFFIEFPSHVWSEGPWVHHVRLERPKIWSRESWVIWIPPRRQGIQA